MNYKNKCALNIGVIKETVKDEKRVALVPETCQKLL